MKQFGKGLHASVCLLLFVICIHSYFECGNAAAAEPKKAGPKEKKVTVVEKIAVINDQIKQSKADVEKKQTQLLQKHKAALQDVERMSLADRARMSLALQRQYAVLHRDRIKRINDMKVHKDVRAAHFKELGRENEIAIDYMKQVYEITHHHRYDRIRNAHKDAYLAKEKKLIDQYKVKVSKLEAKRAQLEKSWAYRWVRVKKWTDKKCQTVTGWFGGDENKKPPVSVAKAKKK